MRLTGKSSDNLAHEPLNDTYLRRAEQGASRLSAILTAINESTRLEAGISNAEKENVVLISTTSASSIGTLSFVAIKPIYAI
jgi:hypothetical protein